MILDNFTFVGCNGPVATDFCNHASVCMCPCFCVSVSQWFVKELLDSSAYTSHVIILM